jgi:hypothetical protein
MARCFFAWYLRRGRSETHKGASVPAGLRHKLAGMQRALDWANTIPERGGCIPTGMRRAHKRGLSVPAWGDPVPVKDGSISAGTLPALQGMQRALAGMQRAPKRARAKN